jgi:hypothetical protein
MERSALKEGLIVPNTPAVEVFAVVVGVPVNVSLLSPPAAGDTLVYHLLDSSVVNQCSFSSMCSIPFAALNLQEENKAIPF